MGEWTEERDAPVAERLAQVTDAVAHASDLADAYWLSRPNFVTVADIRDLRAAWLAERARVAALVQTVSEAHGIPWESAVDVVIHIGNAVTNAKADLAWVTRERDAALARVAALEAERDRHAEISAAQLGLAAASVDEMVGLRERVAALEAVLAEPSAEEVERLVRVGGVPRGLADPQRFADDCDLVRAIRADLRQRAGVTP